MTTLPQRVVLGVVVALVATFLIAPLVIVVLMSLSAGSTLSFPPPGFSTRWYSNLVGDQTWTRAALTSLRIGVTAAALSAVLGTLAALGLVRGRYPARGLVNAVVLSPLIVPLVVTAVGMYLFFVRWQLTGNFWGLALAHTALGIPFVIITVSASLRALDRNVELAAMNLGAGPFQTFFRVTLPLISPGVAIGSLFAFVWSWDELVVAIFLSSPIVRTLPVVMWGQVRSRIDPTIAVVATLLMGITVLLLVSVVLIRRLAQMRMRT
jgi:putative spermidine/putrescine transport system permease protein